MTGADHLSSRTLTIMEALHAAGRPMKSSEIEEATGIYRTSVTKHINWNMLNKWIQIAREEPQGNGYTIKYYALNELGAAKVEARN